MISAAHNGRTIGLFCRQPVLFKDRPQVGLLAGRTQGVGALPYSDDHAVGLASMASTTVRIVERSILFPEDHGKHPSRDRRRKKPARRHRNLSATKQEHDPRLEKVLKRLEAYNVTINAEKTILGADSVDFVGHYVSVDGVRPVLSNVNAILQADPPTVITQLRSFSVCATDIRHVLNFHVLCITCIRHLSLMYVLSCI